MSACCSRCRYRGWPATSRATPFLAEFAPAVVVTWPRQVLTAAALLAENVGATGDPQVGRDLQPATSSGLLLDQRGPVTLVTDATVLVSIDEWIAQHNVIGLNSFSVMPRRMSTDGTTVRRET